MTRILNDKERAKLLEKYKADRMKDAPANISDKTLIENYGNEAQTQLLEKLAPAEPAPKAKTAETAAKTQTGETVKAPEPAPELATTNAAAPEPATENLLTDDKASYERTTASVDNTAYLDAFNEFVRMNDGKTPATSLTTAELVALNEARAEELKNQPEPRQLRETIEQAAADAGEPEDGEAGTTKGMEMIFVVKGRTQKRRVSRIMFERFLSKDGWRIAAEPKEVKNIKK